jgi:large subunit ribosomal protein L18
MKSRNAQRIKRHQRIRNHIVGTPNRPRLAIYRSNQSLYVQVIDDTVGKTIVGMRTEGKSVAAATALGTVFAQALKKQNITTVVFDRAGYLYHGRVQAFADAVRAGGITV